MTRCPTENPTALALNGNVRNQNQKRGFDLFLLTSRFARASARLLYRIIRVRRTLLSLLNPVGFSRSFVFYALAG